MTPEQTLHKYRDLVVVNSDKIAAEISITLEKLVKSDQKHRLNGCFASEFIKVARVEIHPEKVLETIVSPRGDAITSVYLNHSIFASLGDLARARAELIAAIADRVGLSVESAGVNDEGRGRMLGLGELATGQLVDLLAERMGSSIVVPNNRGGYAVPV